MSHHELALHYTSPTVSWHDCTCVAAVWTLAGSTLRHISYLMLWRSIMASGSSTPFLMRKNAWTWFEPRACSLSMRMGTKSAAVCARSATKTQHADSCTSSCLPTMDDTIALMHCCCCTQLHPFIRTMKLHGLTPAVVRSMRLITPVHLMRLAELIQHGSLQEACRKCFKTDDATDRCGH